MKREEEPIAWLILLILLSYVLFHWAMQPEP